MKKLFLFSAIIFLFACQGYSAVTTIDGAITLDFYEDTQFGNNRWILDITLNDIGGGIESVYFDLQIHNVGMTYANEYNFPEGGTQLLNVGVIPTGTFPNYFNIPHIDSFGEVPLNANYILYAMPSNMLIPLSPPYGTPIYDEFDVVLFYANSSGLNRNETLTLHGPIAFEPVPEPTGISLFVFGAFILRWLVRVKQYTN